MKTMPKLVYMLPLSALLIAAFSLFFSPHDEIIFARIIGGPTDSSAGFRGRIQVLSENSGVVASVPDARLELVAKQGRHAVRRPLQTGPDGWVEFFVPRFPEEKLQLEVSHARGGQLVSGDVELSTQNYLASANHRQHAQSRHILDDAIVCLFVPSVVLAVPFASTITVLLRRAAPGSSCADAQATGEPGTEISVKIRGGELLSKERCVSNERGACEFIVRPLYHNVEIEIEVSAAGKHLSFESILPIVPGAFGLEEASDQSGADERRFTIRSPVPRDYAWYTIVSEQGRGPGGFVPLSAGDDGISVGHISLPRSQLEGSFLVLASDADGRSTSAVGYPLSGQRRTFDVGDAYLLDGAGRAHLKSQRRVAKMRIALGLYAFFSILLTTILFYRGIRDEQRDMEDKLHRAGVDDRGVARGSLPLVVAVLCLFFAFSLTLVWTVTR